MIVEYAPSFLRIFKKLDPPLKNTLRKTVEDIIDYYATGRKSLGLGIRNLRGSIWEGRDGLKRRVVFTLGQDQIRFLLAGNHQDVQNFLRHL